MGYFFKKHTFKSEAFWRNLDDLTYYVLMPSMLFYKISHSKLDATDEALKSVIVVFIVIFILTLISLVIKYFVKMSPDKFTSFYQGTVRYNTYIYLAIVEQIYANDGLVIAAFLIAFAIPLINILCVGMFAVFIKDGVFNLKNIFIQIFKNPLILACLLGGIVNYTSFELDIFEVFSLLGASAITLGIICVGAGLNFNISKDVKVPIAISSVLKLIIFPILVYCVAKAIGLNKYFLEICVLFASIPTATSSYILARQLGGDKELMSATITFQTLICPISIWVVLMLLDR